MATGDQVAGILNKAASKATTEGEVRNFASGTTLAEVETLLRKWEIEPVRLFAEAALEALRAGKGQPPRQKRDGLQFIIPVERGDDRLRYTPATVRDVCLLELSVIHDAV